MAEENTVSTTVLLASFAGYNVPLACILALLTNVVVRLITSTRSDCGSQASPSA